MATNAGPTTNSTQIRRDDVVADGDLNLLVGGKLELRVHSLLLKMNSPVFRAMLGPKWLEGHTLTNISETAPGELDLPDDEAEAMKCLCFILHHRNDQLDSAPSPAMFLGIAKAADKYDCIMPTRLTFEAWFSPRSLTVRYGHIAAAYVIGNWLWFSESFAKVILGRSKTGQVVPEFQPGPENGTDEFGIIAALSHRYEYLDTILGGGVVHVVEELSRVTIS